MYKMSLTSFSQYNEIVSSENPHRSVGPEQQGFIAELTKPFQKENFWCLLKKNVFAIDKTLSFLRGTLPPSLASQKYMQQQENLALSSLVEPGPNTNRTPVVPSPAFTSRVNFSLSTQKLNLNNFLMFLLCACIPIGSCIPPPTKIMLCLPCPAPVKLTETYRPQNRCEIFPFGVPRKLDDCDVQASRKGKYLPPPAKRHCSTNCLHVSDLKPVTPCNADKGYPCVAHCFESHPKCVSHY